MATRSLLQFFPAAATSGGYISAAGESCRFEYLQVSRPFFLPPGFHEVDIEIELAHGGVTIGLLNMRGAWRSSINISQSGRYQLRVATFGLVSVTRLVIAACNVQAPDSVRAVITRFTMDSWLLRPAALGAALRDASRRLARFFRTAIAPRIYTARIRYMVWAGRLGLVRGYRVVDAGEIGYASRGVAAVTTPVGQLLITADVGDDSLSLLPLRGGRLQPRSVIACPARSAPMYVSRLRCPDGDRVILSLFNFDESGMSFAETLVGIIEDLSAARRKRKIAVGEDLAPLIRRPGHWGFRGSALHQLPDGRYRLASVDRDRNRFYVLDGSVNESLPREPRSVDLGPSNEPVGINFAAPAAGQLPTQYYLSCRKAAEIIHVQLSPDGNPAVRSRYPMPGLSRSSVAIGNTRSPGVHEVLVAQWGGDPTDLNASGRGSFVALPIGEDGQLGEMRFVAAGTNPTDIVAGDLDGDGLDEVAVLNYGNGQNLAERRDCGDVEIYKWSGDGYVRAARLGIPSPRIGLVADVDGDGQVELVVTAFYERRLAVIKCPRRSRSARS